MLAVCFIECNCQCIKSYPEFDQVTQKELTNSLSLVEICNQEIGWYSDKTLCDDDINSWVTHDQFGLYFLWHKSDYCEIHDKFNMRALYIGKGNIKARITSHMKNKNTANEMLVYFSYIELENRLAKYYEQLFLDTYDFPYNKSENSGQQKLCIHWNQGQVD